MTAQAKGLYAIEHLVIARLRERIVVGIDTVELVVTGVAFFHFAALSERTEAAESAAPYLDPPFRRKGATSIEEHRGHPAFTARAG